MPENTPNYSVVILSYQGTEVLLRALWEKYYHDPFKLVSVPEDYHLFDVLSRLAVDTEVADDFVLVQANVVPLCLTTLETLRFPALYVTAQGAAQYDSRVPVRLSRPRLLELFESLEDRKSFDADAFIKEATIPAGRPVAVSHAYGNFIFQVISGTPCRHRVIEGLLTRRYLATTVAGWKACEELLQEFLNTGGHE